MNEEEFLEATNQLCRELGMEEISLIEELAK